MVVDQITDADVDRLFHALADATRRDIVRRVLDNQPGPARDIVLLNAGAALYTANVTESLAEGIDRARQVLADGLAGEALFNFVQSTQALAASAA